MLSGIESVQRNLETEDASYASSMASHGDTEPENNQSTSGGEMRVMAARDVIMQQPSKADDKSSDDGESGALPKAVRTILLGIIPLVSAAGGYWLATRDSPYSPPSGAVGTDTNVTLRPDEKP